VPVYVEILVDRRDALVHFTEEPLVADEPFLLLVQAASRGRDPSGSVADDNRPALSVHERSGESGSEAAQQPEVEENLSAGKPIVHGPGCPQYERALAHGLRFVRGALEELADGLQIPGPRDLDLYMGRFHADHPCSKGESRDHWKLARKV
jgi:hypothetical protein